MSKYNLTEYSGTYSKTLRGLWQYYRDEPALGNNNGIDFLANHDNSCFVQL